MEITKDPAPILHRKLKAVGAVTDEVRNIIAQMHEMMIIAKGIGLAANQVGIDMQIFVIDKLLAEEHKVPNAYIDPDITDYSKETDEMEEGCLSIPHHWRMIKRSKKIYIKAIGADGRKIKFRARGLLARVLQHETDHLNGMTIQDRPGRTIPETP